MYITKKQSIHMYMPFTLLTRHRWVSRQYQSVPPHHPWPSRAPPLEQSNSKKVGKVAKRLCVG